jgi:hypothetical protein
MCVEWCRFNATSSDWYMSLCKSQLLWHTFCICLSCNLRVHIGFTGSGPSSRAGRRRVRAPGWAARAGTS